MQLDVELTLVALLTYHPATEALELAYDDFDFLPNLELLLHDGHHVFLGAGGDDEVLHLTVGDSEGRVLTILVLMEVVVIVGDDEGQLGDELLVLSRPLVEQGSL